MLFTASKIQLTRRYLVRNLAGLTCCPAVTFSTHMLSYYERKLLHGTLKCFNITSTRNTTENSTKAVEYECQLVQTDICLSLRQAVGHARCAVACEAQLLCALTAFVKADDHC